MRASLDFAKANSLWHEGCDELCIAKDIAAELTRSAASDSADACHGKVLDVALTRRVMVREKVGSGVA